MSAHAAASSSVASRIVPGTSAAPEVEAVPAGPEAGRLHDVDGHIEALADGLPAVRVAAEADRLAALLEEPAHLVDGRERAAGVHLERASAAGQGAEDRAVLLLVVLLLVPVTTAGPVAAREVDV